MRIKKETILSILNLSLVFLMLLLTKFDIKAMLFYTAVYTVLRPPYTVEMAEKMKRRNDNYKRTGNPNFYLNHRRLSVRELR